MSSSSLARYMPGAFLRWSDNEPEKETEFTPAEHDLILRYAIVGIFVILVVGALYITRAISLPVTAGLVFGLVLGPVVDSMTRVGIPQHLAAAIVVLTGVILTASALTLLTAPIALWSDQFPAMIDALRARLTELFSMLRHVEEATEALAKNKGPQVSVAESAPWLNIAISSTAAAGGLLIFVATIYFYLATRRIFKARILRLCLGRSARKSAYAFFEDIESRVSTYLGVVTVVNIVVGLVAALIAWIAGLPYPAFWGALAFLMNYLAFIGPMIVTTLLFAGGLLTHSTLFAAVWPAALYLGLHAVEGNLITPTLVGNRLTVSPFLVFLSFVFWLWLWGPVGAVLSTPLLLIAIVANESFQTYRELRDEAKEEAAAGEASPTGQPNVSKLEQPAA